MENGLIENRYVVGIKIPNDTYAHQPINPVHMTIAFLGAADKERLEKAKMLLAELNQMRPIIIIVGEADTFGKPRHRVSVWRLKIQDPKIEAFLITMRTELSVADPEEPNWHVAAKNLNLYYEFASKENTPLVGGTLFLKQLGSTKSIAEFK